MKEPKYKNYRVCYDNGNAKTGKKLYELDKYCDCEYCTYRFKMNREPSNRIVITTEDISKVDEIAEFLKNWKCEDGRTHVDPIFLRV